MENDELKLVIVHRKLKIIKPNFATKKIFIMKYLIISVLCLFGLWVSAQECNSHEQLKTLPGKWLPQPGDEVAASSPRPSAADAAGAKTVFNRIGKMLQQEYKPVGVDVYNYLTHSITPGSPYGNSYIYTISNFRFLCINGKKTKNDEGVSSSVTINPVRTSGNIQFLEMKVYDESGKLNTETDGTGGFYSLSIKQCKGGKLPDFSNGYHSFEGGNNYNVWVTYEGKMPYRYVSRKEFLEKQVAIGEANLKDLNKHYSSKGWKDNLEMFPQYKEKMLEDKKKHLAMFEKPLEAYRQDLKKDTAWLHEMAVVKQESVSGVYRYVFTTVDDPYMRAVPIMPNPGYYNRKLPKWAPQFMIITVGRTDSFIGENIRKVVDENIEYFKSILTNQ